MPRRRCGKVVVTTAADELPALHQLHERGRATAWTSLIGEPRRARELEPLAQTVGRRSLVADDVGGRPAPGDRGLAAQVRRPADGWSSGPGQSGGVGWLRWPGQRWDVGHVVNSAGLYADVVGGWYGFCDDYVVLPFKGLYWYGNWPAGRLQRHVYPVPDPQNPFLGVHLTVTASGG